jgi:hypothetical protein
MLYKVDASLTAGHLLSQIPGLRHRVEEMLIGILETAEQIRTLQGVDFRSTAEEPMRLHVGNYVVSYLLDVDRRTAKIVFIEMVSRETPAASTLPEAGRAHGR